MRKHGTAGLGDQAPARRLNVVRRSTLELARQIGTLIAALAAVAGFVTIFGSAGTSGAITPPTNGPFNECPNIGHDTTGCQYLIVLNPGGTVTLLSNPNLGPFDGQDDTLFGVLNNSGQSVSSLQLSSTTDIFGFDGDGICAVTITHHRGGGTTTAPTYGSWAKAGASTDTSLDTGQAGCNYGSSTGYAGPGVSYSGYSKSNNYKTGTVNLLSGLLTGGCLPQGQSTYFSLESTLSNANFTVGVTPTPTGCGPTPVTTPVHDARDHAGHDASDHAGHDASDHAGHDARDHAGHDASDHAGHDASDHAGHDARDHAGHDARDHAGDHAGHDA